MFSEDFNVESSFDNRFSFKGFFGIPDFFNSTVSVLEFFSIGSFSFEVSKTKDFFSSLVVVGGTFLGNRYSFSDFVVSVVFFSLEYDSNFVKDESTRICFQFLTKIFGCNDHGDYTLPMTYRISNG